MKIDILDEKKFENLKDSWDMLIDRSDAHRLFMSWIWQFNWWSIWKSRLDIKLLLIAVYNNNDLIGLAPLYLRRANNKFKIGKSIIEILGGCSTSHDSIRTEYLNFIVDLRYSDAVYFTIISYLKKKFKYSILVLLDLDECSSLYAFVDKNFKQNRVIIKEEYCYSIDTINSFEKYLAELSGNTRRRVFNKRLSTLKNKDVLLKAINSKEEFSYFISTLNKFYHTRWGKKALSEHSVNFFISIFEQGLLKAKLLYVDQTPIAACMDVIYEGCAYNMQLAYVENFLNLSSGWMMLGFMIESYTDEKNIIKYDLLAGNGKNENYKMALFNNTNKLVSIKLFNSSYIKFLYMIIEKIKWFIKMNQINFR